ncbi:hypothetical protein [Sorangium sp. So ce131]|uniref:hypothetical protein n=1 Tax=Sorangium sp. So ce131 TaxID=3133282 RepID=UPI003F62B1DD
MKNIDIDYVYAEGTSSHAVEAYGVDDLRVGTVVARNTGECASFANSSDITIQNLTITNTAVNESPCAVSSTFGNLTLVNARDNSCD